MDKTETLADIHPEKQKDLFKDFLNRLYQDNSKIKIRPEENAKFAQQGSLILYEIVRVNISNYCIIRQFLLKKVYFILKLLIINNSILTIKIRLTN